MHQPIFKVFIVILFGAFTAAVFQNCTDAEFNTQQQATRGNTQGDDANTGPDQLDNGLIANPIQEALDVEGGHFDLDTATEVYGDGDGDTNKHVHEYDDKHETNVVNFFNLIDKDFDNIDQTVNNNDSFYIIVANADLSPRVTLEINGAQYAIATGPFGPFSLSGAPGTTTLTGLRAFVATDAIVNQGLVSTQTGCVVKNDFSADGRYRNGALVFQAIAADQLAQVDPVQNVATSNAALLWEGILFWHEDGGDCR